SQTALGLVTPVPFIATPQGPPHIGATGWLFHFDAPSLVLYNLRPAKGGADAIQARFLECSNHSHQAKPRCLRHPPRAYLIDGRGDMLRDCTVKGDAVQFEVLAGDLNEVRVDFA